MLCTFRQHGCWHALFGLFGNKANYSPSTVIVFIRHVEKSTLFFAEKKVWCSYLEYWCSTQYLRSLNQRSWSGKHGKWRKLFHPLSPWPTGSHSTFCRGVLQRKVHTVWHCAVDPHYSWTTLCTCPVDRSSLSCSRGQVTSPLWESEGCWRSGVKMAALELCETCMCRQGVKSSSLWK